MISASVAPLACPIISRILAPLLSERGAGAAFVGSDLPIFLLLVLAALFGFGAAALALPPALPAFAPLGAPFFCLAPFFEGAASDATCAPCSAAVAVVLPSRLVILVGYPFLRPVGA